MGSSRGKLNMYVCTYIYIYIYIYTYINTHIYIHTHIYLYIHVHVCLFIYINLDTCSLFLGWCCYFEDNHWRLGCKSNTKPKKMIFYTTVCVKLVHILRSKSMELPRTSVHKEKAARSTSVISKHTQHLFCSGCFAKDSLSSPQLSQSTFTGRCARFIYPISGESKIRMSGL